MTDALDLCRREVRRLKVELAVTRQELRVAQRASEVVVQETTALIADLAAIVCPVKGDDGV